MSQLLINQYLNELATLKKVSGASRESVVREAFKDLLKAWGKSQNLIFIPEQEFITTAKVRNYIDGALVHDLRVPFGYWEAKDADDDLDAEIVKKFRRGYPNTNIIFEDSTKAVLFQHGVEVMRCAVDGPELQKLLELFFGYQRPEIADFRKAVIQFKTDLPAVLDALRGRIDTAYAENAQFKTAAAAFLAQAKRTINPSVSEDDVREMLIQHILTEEIFAHVFNEGDFHRQNNVAQALYGLENEFFKGDVKRQTLAALEPYYAAKVAAISKDDIFAYVYAVLYDPIYRETYALNLKREFPRIPLYPDFKRWRDWGQALLDLHIGYETVAPAILTRIDTPDPKRAEGTSPAVKLKSDPDMGVVVLDTETQLTGIPTKAWDYRLGNRSAIDWVLDQHKEKTPKDPTIRERFNTYRFADHKEKVVELLGRVVAVSLATVEIVEAMRALPPSARDQKTKAED
jgi:predicted helicase